MFFKNILGGPDLNPLPNDVSDACPERGARVPVAIINLKFNVTNSSLTHCTLALLRWTLLILEHPTFFQDVHILLRCECNQKIFFFLIFHCRWDDKCTANSLSLLVSLIDKELCSLPANPSWNQPKELMNRNELQSDQSPPFASGWLSLWKKKMKIASVAQRGPALPLWSPQRNGIWQRFQDHVDEDVDCSDICE